jgi:Ca2+-binding RTX toxin-like protein
MTPMAFFIATAGNDFFAGTAIDLNDTVSYASTTSTIPFTGVKVNLSLAGPQATVGSGSDTFFSIENLIGSSFNDTLIGNASNNIIEGGAGNDYLDGGAGIDTASYGSAGAGVRVSLAVTVAQNTLGAGIDTLLNFENLRGSRYDDRLSGNFSNNVIDGGAGNDWLDGGAGSDTLIGGEGNDIIIGGLGQDKLSGGTGKDIFQFNNVSESPSSLPDYITDFNSLLGDRIDVSAIDANIASSGNQVFVWVGLVAGGSIGQGNLGYQISGSDLILLGNTGTSIFNPSVTPDFRVVLVGAAPSGLSAANVNL